jgi:uncharacterized membrane-anchored protein YitT (DUF2179 family)
MSRIRREAMNALFIVLGILSAAMGIKGFLLSSGFIDGGVTGVSMLLSKVTGAPLAILLPAINLPFVALGMQQMGAAFAIRSVIGIAGLAGALAVVPFPDVTPDLVLTAVFGGFFLGAGIGLAIRGGAVLDGTEIAALLVSRRGDVLRIGDVILGFNVVLFVSAMAVLGVTPVLYSILTYLAAAKTLDFVINGIDEYTAVTIVSDVHRLSRAGRRRRRRREGARLPLAHGASTSYSWTGWSIQREFAINRRRGACLIASMSSLHPSKFRPQLTVTCVTPFFWSASTA